MSNKFSVYLEVGMIDKISGPLRGLTGGLEAKLEKFNLLEARTARRKKRDEDRATKEKEKHADREEKVKRLKEEKKKRKEHREEEELLHPVRAKFVEGLGKAFGAIPQLAGIGAVFGGIEGVVDGYKEITQAADKARMSQVQLETTLLHVKGQTKENVKEVMEAAEKMEGRSTYSHTVFETAAAGLATAGMKAKQIKAMMPAIADYLAKVKGVNATTEDGADAAKIMVRAYAGNVGSLSRYGIILTKAQQALLKHGTADQKSAVLTQAIETRMGGLAQKEADTPEGQAKRASIAWEAVQEKLGQALTPMRMGVVNVLSWAIPYIRRFADWIPGAFQKLGNFLRPVFGPIVMWLKGLFGGSGGVGKTFSGWVPEVLGLWKRLSAFWEEFAPKLADWFSSMWTSIQPALKSISASLRDLWDNVLVPLWHDVLEPLMGFIIKTVVPWLVGEFGVQLKQTVDYLSAIVKGIQGFGDALGNAIVMTQKLLGQGAGNNDGMEVTHGAGSRASDPNALRALAEKQHAARLAAARAQGSPLGSRAAQPTAQTIHIHHTVTGPPGFGVVSKVRGDSPHGASRGMAPTVHAG